MLAEKFDTSYRVETPESIDLIAQLAGPIPRVLAYCIDLAIRSIVQLLILIVLLFAGKAGMGIFLVISFLMEWFYPVFFEVLRDGQTPGKKALKIAVVSDDLTPVTWSTSIIRNLLRAADFLPMGYAFGLIAMTTSGRFQRFGDIAAGSLVIYRREISKDAFKLPESVATPPPVALSLEDQVAFTGYVQRHSQLSHGRKEELANILEPVTQTKGDAAVKLAQGIGNWLLGHNK
ncbi:putative RDD family membrane protein YckC [Alteromonadaceae bacterium 2753L.S.0a.02]|nr:putative RDD family membrane protein YckC [Alteromonadaceae bacterium 2753L.S.0a.02]